jgi:two-component system phosphate regulon sensor histidine kinase PhoR
MHPRFLFWVPATLRLSFVLLASCLAWYLAGPLVGMTACAICMVALVLVQLHYLHRLSGWLENPDSNKLPDGWGAWTEIFARLYKLRRDDEKSRTELTEWLARFRQAMNLLPDGVVIMDDVLALEWCNPAAQSHLGLQNDRDNGMRITNLIRSPDFINYVIVGRYDQPLTLALKNRKLIMQIIPFENHRQILVTHDATESERIEMMRRDFIANASHELRTPLTVVNGFLEIAMGQPNLDPETRMAHLKLMTEQGQRMQILVEDMLTLTRLESVEYPLRSERVIVKSLLAQILQEAQALSGGKHTIELSIDGPDIKGSTEELRSAFSNLVSNAVRYTPKHGKIRLSWRMTETGARFAVQDTGIGIPAEHILRLTERFYRVDKSRSRETRGTGLGLAIVKHVLLRHGALLAIESTPDVGSTFTAKFPKAAVLEARVEQAA